MWLVIEIELDQVIKRVNSSTTETYGCILSTVATDALVLKHQAISIHSADWISIMLDKIHKEILQL